MNTMYKNECECMVITLKNRYSSEIGEKRLCALTASNFRLNTEGKNALLLFIAGDAVAKRAETVKMKSVCSTEYL